MVDICGKPLERGGTMAGILRVTAAHVSMETPASRIRGGELMKELLDMARALVEIQ